MKTTTEITLDLSIALITTATLATFYRVEHPDLLPMHPASPVATIGKE